jgi:hypothetical protein
MPPVDQFVVRLVGNQSELSLHRPTNWRMPAPLCNDMLTTAESLSLEIRRTRLPTIWQPDAFGNLKRNSQALAGN